MLSGRRAQSVIWQATLLAASMLCGACDRKDAPGQAPPHPAAAASAVNGDKATPVTGAQASAAGASPIAAPAGTPARSTIAPRYAWLSSAAAENLKRDGTLASRLPPPPGYTRTPVEPGSFGEWLRGLPMAPPDTPVTTFDGTVVHPADDDYVAGVIAIDVGSSDLQQSPDVILRLNAEWLWSRGEIKAISYRGASKLAMPLTRWEKGQRIVSAGDSVFWAVKNKPKQLDYPEFRHYLDAVFTWANSTSLAQRARRVQGPDELALGDFFLHARAPGHLAIVLDIAAKPSGERVALLGQALNPAQSVHIVRPGRATAWFSLRPGLSIVTPNTKEFSWDELRRLEAAGDDEASGPDKDAPSAQDAG